MDGIKTRLVGLLFDKLPTYAQLNLRTADGLVLTDVNPIFLPKFEPTPYMAGQTRKKWNHFILALKALERQLETLDIVTLSDGQIICNLC